MYIECMNVWMLKVMYSLAKTKEQTSNSEQNTWSLPSYGVDCACIAECRWLLFVCICAERKNELRIPCSVYLCGRTSTSSIDISFVVSDLQRAGCMYVRFITTQSSNVCFIIWRFRWPYISWWGTALGQWLKWCATNRKVARSIPEVSLEFFIDVILLIALWPLSRPSLLQKRLKGLFPGGKNGRCLRLTTLTTSWAIVM
jgi:hypothetical protein